VFRKQKLCLPVYVCEIHSTLISPFLFHISVVHTLMFAHA
jgi:hypothetical protein